MKRIFNTVGNIIGIMFVIGAGVVLVLTLRGASLSDEQPVTFQSPIEKAISMPTATILSPRRISPITTPTLVPMSAKATIAALGAEHKVTAHPLTPIRSTQDVIDIVLNDLTFQHNLDSPMFGANSKNAIPSEPIPVTLIGKQNNGNIYYVVPFYADEYITGLATVMVDDGQGRMGMWSNTKLLQFPYVTVDEAIKLVTEQKFTVADTPQLVFRLLRESGDETSPFWQVDTKEGITFYVIYMLGKAKLYRADEVHPRN